MKRRIKYSLITGSISWYSWHWREGKYCYSRSWKDDRQFSCTDGAITSSLSKRHNFPIWSSKIR
jgi:hypothetical protein